MATTPGCYWRESGSIQQSFDYRGFTSPCGPVNSTNPVVGCCVNGDICMSDGFCYYTHSEVGGSGYYSASCTDPSYESPVCQNRCVNDRLLDSVYEPSTGLWACCTNSTSPVQCQNPFNETFAAPAPASLSALFSIPPTGFSPTSQVATATATSSITSTTPAPSATTSNSSQHSSLSSGASAGIGIGVTLIAVLAIAGVLFLWFRRRRGSKVGVETPEEAQAENKAGWKPVAQTPMGEAPAGWKQAARNPMAEAPAYSPRLPAELSN